LTPTAESGKAQLTDPVTEKFSLFTKPTYEGVPVTVAEVVPSTSLLTAVRPEMVSALAETELPLAAVVTFTLVAPVLARTMFWEL
jgi:hypothetical protein